jgi:ribose/xylose/arabinose/galactoside ABC-type transport system permease subunit
MRLSLFSIILFIILGLTIIGLYIGTNKQILSKVTLETIGYQIPVLGFLTFAQFIPMVNGGIDLSIISVANFAGIIAAILMKQFSYSPLIAILSGIAAALVVGSINGIMISIVKAPALLVTLATGFLVKGISLGITKGYIISGLPNSFVVLGAGNLLGIPISFLLLLLTSCILALTFARTAFGRSIYLVGANPLASLFSGISTRNIHSSVYICSAFLSGIAGLIMAARFNAAQADYGGGFLLVTVLICVLGGVSPTGGTGRISDVFVALAILQLISTGFNVMRTSAYLATALWGMLLLGILLITRRVSKHMI